jgi:hypothetical protein
MNEFSRTTATIMGIAVPGVLIAVTAFVSPLPSGSGSRGPEQIRLPATAITALCPGPLDLTAEDAVDTDEEFEASDAPTTVARAVSVTTTAPDGSDGAGGIGATVVDGDEQFRTDPGEPFVTGADGMGAPVVYEGEPAGESPVHMSAVQTASAEDGDYAGLSALACATPVTRAVFSGASTLTGEDSRLLIGNPTDAPVTVRVALTGETGPLAVAGQDELTVQPRSMRTVVLGALAQEAAVLGAEVTAEDGRITTVLQRTRRDGLTPLGIEHAAPEAPAAARSVVPIATGGQARLRVTNQTDRAVSAQLGAHAADGPMQLANGSVAVPAHGTAEVDLGEISPGDVVLDADGELTASVSVTVDTPEGEDIAQYPGVEAVGAARLLTLPTDEVGNPLEGDIAVAAGEGSVEIVPVLGDGQRGEPQAYDLEADRAIVLGLADFPDARALEVRGTEGDAFATVGVRTESGVSGVTLPPEPEGIGYRDVRLER